MHLTTAERFAIWASRVALIPLALVWRLWARRRGAQAGRLPAPLAQEVLRASEQGLSDRMAPVRARAKAPMVRLRGQFAASLAMAQAFHSVAVSRYQACVAEAGGRQVPDALSAFTIAAFVAAAALEVVLNFVAAAGFLPDSPFVVASGAVLLTMTTLGCAIAAGSAVRQRSKVVAGVAVLGLLLALVASCFGRLASLQAAASESRSDHGPWTMVSLVTIQLAIAVWAVCKAYDATEPVAGFRRVWRRVRRTGAAAQQLEAALAEAQSRIDRRVARIDSLESQLRASMRRQFLLGQATRVEGDVRAGAQQFHRKALGAALLLTVGTAVTACGTVPLPLTGSGGRCIYVMVDRSASMPRDGLVREVLAVLPASVQPGDRIVVAIVGQHPLHDVGSTRDVAVAGSRADRLAAALGLSTRASTTQWAKVQQALREQLGAVAESLMARPSERGSSLLDAVSVAARSICAEAPDGQRVLLMISDAQEHSPSLSLERSVANPADLARAAVRHQRQALGWPMSLHGWRVIVAGVRSRTPEHWHALAVFWRIYVAELGGVTDPADFGAAPHDLPHLLATRRGAPRGTQP